MRDYNKTERQLTTYVINLIVFRVPYPKLPKKGVLDI